MNISEFRLNQYVTALGLERDAGNSLTAHLLAELALFVSGSPDWSKLTQADITGESIAHIAEFVCQAYFRHGESEGAKQQFQTNERRRFVSVLKKFGVIGKVETVYRLSDKTTSKPAAFEPQVSVKGFELGLRFIRKVSDSDPFNGTEDTSIAIDGQSPLELIEQANAEKKERQESEAIQARAQTLAAAMSKETLAKLADTESLHQSAITELNEARAMIRRLEAQVLNLTTERDNAVREVAKLQAEVNFVGPTMPTKRVRKSRV